MKRKSRRKAEGALARWHKYKPLPPTPSTAPCHNTLVKVSLGIWSFSYCIQMSIMENSQNQFSSCYQSGRDEFGYFFFLTITT